MKKYDLVIIGGGSAGMGAAISAHKSGVKNILILEKDNCLGGILNQCIHNGFGLVEFKEELTGPEYLERFIKQVEDLKICYKLNSFVLRVSKDKIITYSSKDEGVVQIVAKAIIFATGCFERTAGQILLTGDRPSGIITAGTAQKYLNIHGYLVGKKVVIIGSGDIGLIMARRLTLEGAKVLGVVEINSYSAGLARNITQCLDDFNIPLYLSHIVTDVKGKARVERVSIAEIDKERNIIPGTEKTFECDTLLLSVGLSPYIILMKNMGLKIINGKVFTYDNLETSIPGVFNCGNSLHVHDIVDYVTSEAYLAGESAAKYLQKAKFGREIPLIYSENISYALPGIIREDQNILSIKFRVKYPMKNVIVSLRNNNEVISFGKKIALNPSELEIIKISKTRINSWDHPIELEVKE